MLASAPGMARSRPTSPRPARPRRPARRLHERPAPPPGLTGPLARLRRTRALAAALTHPSTSGPGAAAARHLRLRLELLGDAVWNLAVIQTLLREGTAPRADLARRKAHLAGGPFMADVARRARLGGALRIGPGPDAAALRDRPSVLASTLEAVLGAWYLQAGLPPVLRFVARALARTARHERPGASFDPKSDLQQAVTRRFHTLPAYRIVEQAGSAHAPEFRVEVAVNGRVLGIGRGTSRRAAEQAAAREALHALEWTREDRAAHKI